MAGPILLLKRLLGPEPPERWQVVAGVKVDVILTADLPAAGSSQDGRVVIEDAGAGDRNIVIYAAGARYRVDGGAGF